MLAGIDVASDRHMLARLDVQGVPLGEPVPITEDREGCDTLLRLLGPPPVLVAMEATGHYWKNLCTALVAAGHSVVLLNPLKTRRFQDSALERAKTDATGVARFAFEKRPEATQLHDAAAEALRELVRHRDRIRQDFDDRAPAPPPCGSGLSRAQTKWFGRVHPIRARAGQHAGGRTPFRMPHRARLRPHHAETAGQAALRRAPLGRSRACHAADRGRQALHRPAPRARVSAAGPPRLPGSRPMAQAPGRDRARHRR